MKTDQRTLCEPSSVFILLVSRSGVRFTQSPLKKNTFTGRFYLKDQRFANLESNISLFQSGLVPGR